MVLTTQPAEEVGMATPSSITIPERLLTRLSAPARAPGSLS